jgi:hypothetical protein
MTTAAKAEVYNGFSITLRRTTIPAFALRTSYWLKYDDLAKRGLTSIDVDLVIQGRHFGDGDVCTDINAYFDPSIFPCNEIGLVYGDDLFEINVVDFVRDALILPDGAIFTYTEQGMQTDEYISMQGNTALDEYLMGLSNHALLRLTANPLVTGLRANGSVLKG